MKDGWRPVCDDSGLGMCAHQSDSGSWASRSGKAEQLLRGADLMFHTSHASKPTSAQYGKRIKGRIIVQ